MKKLFYFAVILFAIIYGLRWFVNSVQASQYKPQAQNITNNTKYPSSTPQPTATIIPSVTIDYQVTAVLAQQTAMEAVRVNAQITAEFEQRIQEQLQMTAEADRRNQEIYSWTQQAAATSIPLTATQQAVINTQIPQQQMIIAGQMTATHQAPTQAYAMIKANGLQKFGDVEHVGFISLQWIGIIFLIGLIVWMFLRWNQEERHIKILEQKEIVSETQGTQLETVVWVKNTKDNGTKSVRLVIPCSSDQLTELSELAVNGERTFGINKLENTSRTLRSKRDVIYQFREFLLSNDYAFPPKPGEIALNDNGTAFLRGWFDTHQLPTEYEFDVPHSPDNGASSNHDENTEKSPINMISHSHDNGGGVDNNKIESSELSPNGA